MCLSPFLKKLAWNSPEISAKQAHPEGRGLLPAPLILVLPQIPMFVSVRLQERNANMTYTDSSIDSANRN